jgi:predicted metal-dependent hydrolase
LRGQFVKRSKRADPDLDGTRFRRGVELFNREEFWDAHEAWEAEWLAATGERAQLLQGLIQLAAACYHVQKGTLRSAEKLRRISVGRLSSLPDGFGGLALRELCDRALQGSWTSTDDLRAIRLRYVDS